MILASKCTQFFGVICILNLVVRGDCGSKKFTVYEMYGAQWLGIFGGARMGYTHYISLAEYPLT